MWAPGIYFLNLKAIHLIIVEKFSLKLQMEVSAGKSGDQSQWNHLGGMNVTDFQENPS